MCLCVAMTTTLSGENTKYGSDKFKKVLAIKKNLSSTMSRPTSVHVLTQGPPYVYKQQTIRR